MFPLCLLICIFFIHSHIIFPFVIFFVLFISFLVFISFYFSPPIYHLPFTISFYLCPIYFLPSIYLLPLCLLVCIAVIHIHIISPIVILFLLFISFLRFPLSHYICNFLLFLCLLIFFFHWLSLSHSASCLRSPLFPPSPVIAISSYSSIYLSVSIAFLYHTFPGNFLSFPGTFFAVRLASRVCGQPVSIFLVSRSYPRFLSTVYLTSFFPSLRSRPFLLPLTFILFYYRHCYYYYYYCRFILHGSNVFCCFVVVVVFCMCLFVCVFCINLFFFFFMY